MTDDKETQLQLVAYRLNDISDKVDSLVSAVKGNGKPGMVMEIERLRANVAKFESDVVANKRMIAEIKADMQERKVEDERLRSRLKGMAIGVTLAGLGGGGGLAVLLQNLVK